MKHPTRFTGTYPTNWAGYYFKQTLGYTSGKHTGVDYNWGAGSADCGQSVVAIGKGVVRIIGDYSGIGFGKTVVIEHPFGVQKGATKSYSRYMHLNSIAVKTGQTVKEGQKIGTLGRTGTKFCHLHIDLWSNKRGLKAHLDYHKDTKLESYVDPFRYIESHKDDNIGDDMYKGKSAKHWYNEYQKYRKFTIRWRTRYQDLYKKIKSGLGKYLGR